MVPARELELGLDTFGDVTVIGESPFHKQPIVYAQ
jgi:hypothetical protein